MLIFCITMLIIIIIIYTSETLQSNICNGSNVPQTATGGMKG